MRGGVKSHRLVQAKDGPLHRKTVIRRSTLAVFSQAKGDPERSHGRQIAKYPSGVRKGGLPNVCPPIAHDITRATIFPKLPCKGLDARSMRALFRVHVELTNENGFCDWPFL